MGRGKGDVMFQMFWASMLLLAQQQLRRSGIRRFAFCAAAACGYVTSRDPVNLFYGCCTPRRA